MNKRTVALTDEQYTKIIDALISGGDGFRPNRRIATVLVLEANLGLRLSDVLNLHLQDIIKDGGRYRLNIFEQKTGKYRNFTVPFEIYQYIENYCLRNRIESNRLIFPISKRVVQKQLKIVCNYLGFDESIGTHSFRKYFATNIYKNNNYDIKLVQTLLQHSSTETTQRYIGMAPERIETALANHIHLI